MHEEAPGVQGSVMTVPCEEASLGRGFDKDWSKGCMELGW